MKQPHALPTPTSPPTVTVAMLEALVHAIETRGVNAVRQEIGTSREALTRVAAKLRVHPGTSALVVRWYEAHGNTR